LMTPKRVDKDERRREILGAATRAFARKGYSATRIEDIAAEAGIAQGTVHLYFGGREEILVAAFEAFAERMITGVRAVLEADSSALDRLRSVVRVVLSSLESEPELSRVVLDFWSAGAFGAGGSEEKPGIDFGKVYAEYRGIFSELLEEARREGSVRTDLPEDTPAVIVGAIEGVALQWILDSEDVRPVAMADSLLDVLLNGLSERRES
jgi:TetR/AcrR family transcriptional regulator, fatty acid metabolism regulator protein